MDERGSGRRKNVDKRGPCSTQGLRRGGFEGVEWEERREETERKSKDRKINKERKRLVGFLEEKEWTIFNGASKENEEEEYTYIGNKENTVIDYMIGRKG